MNVAGDHTAVFCRGKCGLEVGWSGLGSWEDDVIIPSGSRSHTSVVRSLVELRHVTIQRIVRILSLEE